MCHKEVEIVTMQPNFSKSLLMEILRKMTLLLEDQGNSIWNEVSEQVGSRRKILQHNELKLSKWWVGSYYIPHPRYIAEQDLDFYTWNSVLQYSVNLNHQLNGKRTIACSRVYGAYHGAWGMIDPQQTFTEPLTDPVPTFKRFFPIFTCLSGLNSGTVSSRKLSLISRVELITCLCVPITPWVFFHLSFSLKREKQVNGYFHSFYQPLSKTTMGLVD